MRGVSDSGDLSETVRQGFREFAMPIALRGALLLALLGSLGALTCAVHAEEPEFKATETVKQAPSITRFGITWHFDREARCGVFVNGDPWVLGPVTIVSVTPAPGPAAAETRTKVDKNQFGDASLQDDNRMRNGSMVLLQASSKQGFDSRARNYAPELSVAFPYTLEPQRSLISTKSVETFPNPNFLKGHGEKSSSMLETAAVLTCLAEPPPADAFRPCYGGVDKPLYRAGALKRERLLQLKPVDSAPPLEEYIGYFSRPWIEYGATWMQQATAPNLNRPNYGREFARVVSMGALHLLLNHSAQEKEPLLVGLVQVGIDLHGMTKIGLNYTADGGHYSCQTFLATSKLVSGVIRVVLLQHQDGNWAAYLSTDPTMSVEKILEAVSDRWAIEEHFHDVKEIWGAGQQQVRNLWSNIGCWNLCGWLYTLVELACWDEPAEQLVDRSDRPWDSPTRRPSHADRRRRIAREMLRAEFLNDLPTDPEATKIKERLERLLALAA